MAWFQAAFATAIVAVGTAYVLVRRLRPGARRRHRRPLPFVDWALLVVISMFVAGEAFKLAGSDVLNGVIVGPGLLTLTIAGWEVVVSFHPRAAVAGRRRTRFPFSAIMFALLGASVVVPVLLVVTGNGVMDAVMSSLVLFAIAGFVARLVRRAGTPQAESLARLYSGERSVLLLRGFDADWETFSAADERRARQGLRRRIGYLFPSREDFRTAEQYLGAAIRSRIGPLVGLGDPTDYLPPDRGLLRLYAADDKWRDTVAALIPHTRAVLVVAGTTRSLGFELLLLRALAAETRTFLLVPPRQHEPVRDWFARVQRMPPAPGWPVWASYFEALGYTLPAADPGPGTVLGFDGFGHAAVLVSGAEDARTYAEAIAGALERRPEPSALLDRLDAEYAMLRRSLDTVDRGLTPGRFEAIMYRGVVAHAVATTLRSPAPRAPADAVRHSIGVLEVTPDEVDSRAAEILTTGWLSRR